MVGDEAKAGRISHITKYYKLMFSIDGGAFLRHLRQHLTIPLQKLGDRIENTTFVIHLARWMIADQLDL